MRTCHWRCNMASLYALRSAKSRNILQYAFSLRYMSSSPSESFADRATVNASEPEVPGHAAVPAVEHVVQYDTSSKPFPPEILTGLRAGLKEDDVEIKPDGIIYLPEIKYRRVLLDVFGAGGWVLVPVSVVRQGMINEGYLMVTREYALYCHGQLVSATTGAHVSRQAQPQLDIACESAKSNALMRCCKDLGIASELWDPQYITRWKNKHAIGVWCIHQRSREKKMLWRKIDSTVDFPYPWKEC